MAESAPALPASSGTAASSSASSASSAANAVESPAMTMTATTSAVMKMPPHPSFNDRSITAAEKTGLAELRSALVDCKDAAGMLYSLDTRLVKYLRARESVEEAAEFFKSALEYRMKNGFMIDELLTEFKPAKEIFTHVCKFPVPFFHDKEGGLVLYNRAGLLYGSKLCTKLGKQTVCKTFAWFLEHMTRSATANIAIHPAAAPYLTIILDLTGFGSHCFGPLGTTTELIKVFQNLYPETLKRCLLVNTPWMFRVAWRVISPFLNPVVQKKILVLKGPSSDKIFEFVDKDQVPAFMGGNMTENGDKYCGNSILPNGDPYI